MRIFISSVDETGTKRNTRINLHNCTNTAQLVREISKELGVGRQNIIVKIKMEPHNVQYRIFS